jgi:predicted metalloprotease with PDZ domain
MRAAMILMSMASGAFAAADADRFSWAPVPPPGNGIVLAVDAADLPAKGLVYAREWISGPALADLVFPLWIPGTHAPSGPVQNLGGLVVSDDRGNPLWWSRDFRDPWAIHVKAGSATRVRVDLTYIANQPSTNSRGVDISCGPNGGVVNWNCVLFYPKDAPIGSLACTPSIRLPENWDYASALDALDPAQLPIVSFKPTTLSATIDSPVLCGLGMRHLPLRAGGAAPVTLDVVSSASSDDEIEDQDLLALGALPDETDALFGGSWFPRYHLLLLLGNDYLGLEHGESALTGLPFKSFSDEDDTHARELLPHEFTHSWNGKHRRPIGMLTPTYQENPDQQDLWVYEGLTEFLGRVLAVRCGLLADRVWRASILEDIERMERTPGRSWRSLRDTCASSWQLRGGSPAHDELRRNQDYYIEGALFWLVVDRHLREATSGKLSIDDFCHAFLGPHGMRTQGYTEAELVATLDGLSHQDWAGLIAAWIDRTGPLNRDAILGGSGWMPVPSPVDKADSCELAHVSGHDLAGALDCRVSGGWVREVVPDGLAAKAGLKDGDFILGVNQKNLRELPHGIAEVLAGLPASTPIAVSFLREGQYGSATLTPRELTIDVLVRKPSEPDAFSSLLAPHRRPAAVAP